MRRLPRFYVYLLLCRDDGTTYTGYTANLRRRFKEHNSPANTGWTRWRRWHLLVVTCFLDRDTALLFERRVKRSGRRKRAWIKRVRRRLDTLCERHGIRAGHK